MNIMKLNKIILSLSFVLLASFTFAQQQNREEVVFRAMRDEIARTKTISMGQLPPPFLVNYYLEDGRSLAISSQYGSIMSINKDQPTAKIGAEIFIGNHKKNSKLEYSGKIGAMGATTDNNYLSLRTSFWNISDIIYKNSLKEFEVKNSAMQQMTLNDDEKEISDIIKTGVVKQIGKNTPAVVFNEEKWSTVCNTLSAIFKKYPDLRNTAVNYRANDKAFYILNSEGLELTQNACFVSISAMASIQDESGVIMSNGMSIFATNDNELPNEEQLVKRVEEFAKKMSSLKNVENIKEYYNGPVMFTGGAVTNIFANNLLGGSGLIATKTLTNKGWLFNAMERRLDRKIIDYRLTIKNYTSKKEHNGEKLVGSYDIDADGVTPAEETTLVEKGILKNMLFGTSETPINKTPTGSNRISLTSKGIEKVVSPGVLQISVDKGIKEASMKKELIKLAKEEGLNYAYIVHSMANNCPEFYRIDVKSGEQTRVGSTKISAIDMPMLRRIAAISADEIVSNNLINGVLTTVISPKSIILNDIEIDMNKSNKSPLPLLPSPLKR